MTYAIASSSKTIFEPAGTGNVTREVTITRAPTDPVSGTFYMLGMGDSYNNNVPAANQSTADG